MKVEFTQSQSLERSGGDFHEGQKIVEVVADWRRNPSKGLVAISTFRLRGVSTLGYQCRNPSKGLVAISTKIKQLK